MNDINISVIIPVYNSYYSIEEVAQRTIDCLEGAGLNFEIIMVDDFSKDDTLRRLIKMSEKDRRIRTISLDRNHGQQEAIKIGMGYAKGDYIVTMDDDLEHQPEDILLLLNHMEKGYDIVYGLPRNKKYPLYRKCGSKVVDLFFTICFNKPHSIKVSSFRVLNRKICDRIIEDRTPFVYISAISLKYTMNIGNIGIQHMDRKYGSSNYDVVKLTKLFLKLLYFYKINQKRYRVPKILKSQEH